MKLNTSGFDRFLRRPDDTVYAALIYGNDAGQVSECIAALKKTWLGKQADHFSETILSAGQLASSNGSLNDELAAYSLTNGPRSVHMKHPASEDIKAIISALKGFADGPPPVAHLLVEAGGLPPTSALRKTFEQAPAHAIAFACYPDKAGDVSAFSKKTLEAAGHSIEPAALDLLVASVPRDRRVLRLELEKLLCFMADRVGAKIGPDDISAVIAQAGEVSLDDLVYACTSGMAVEADIALQRALDAGQAPVMVARAIARHLVRLHEVVARAQAGGSVVSAMAKLRPPVFVMHRDRFARQANAWTPRRLQGALAKVVELERGLRSSQGAQTSRLGRFVLAISSTSH